jgi:glycosyltransferase involved in cell wall biosynthesis
MTNDKPLVSCIMPTANRHKFIPLTLQYFFAQDYPNKELIVIDDGSESVADLIPQHPQVHYYYTQPLGTIGVKRNFAINKALGEIIMHWDDDDYYASDWITRQINTINETGADLTGLNRVFFYSPAVNKTWMYEDIDDLRPWICGATMSYKKTLWENHPFVDLQVGEDYDFVWNCGGKIVASDYINGFVAILHPHNTSIKPVEHPKHKKNPTSWIAPDEQTKI